MTTTCRITCDKCGKTENFDASGAFYSISIIARGSKSLMPLFQYDLCYGCKEDFKLWVAKNEGNKG